MAQDTSRADLSNLSKDEQLQVLSKVEEFKKSHSGPLTSTSTPQQVSQWVDIGKQVADLIPVFAESIAADKVLNSFSGKVLLAIVLVHFFWAAAIAADPERTKPLSSLIAPPKLE